MELSFVVRSYDQMVSLGATLDLTFPEGFLMHQPVKHNVLSVGSVASARGMELLVLHRVRHYGWTVTNLPALRNLAHLSEMVGYIDDYLLTIAERVQEGEPLGVAKRKDMFEPLEEMAYAVERAGQDCVRMVSGPATTLARRIAFLAKNAQRCDRRFPRRRIRNRIDSAREEVIRLMQLAPPV